MLVDDEAERARELSAEGQRLLGTGEHERAVLVFIEAARAFGGAGDILSEASYQRVAADICLVMQRYQEALDSNRRALELYEKLGDAEKQTRVLANIGLIEAQGGQGQSAVGRFRRSLELFERIGSTFHVAQQWGNLGSTYRDMHEYDLAMDSYRHALPTYEGLDHAVGIADQYTNMAYIHTLRDEVREALALYQKALPLYDQATDSRKRDLTAQNKRALQAVLDEEYSCRGCS
ncbi:MAG: tetratricopeptide repeat protein [Dehalococcoidia bacterium]|nr:tetratricopeptide repeat protein [Dehalococcoidia bacterium]